MAKSSLNRGVFSLVMAAALAGCSTMPATTEVDPAVAISSPELRVLYQAPADADATITVVRDFGIVAGPCFLGLFVDGKLAARLAFSEKVQLRVKAGAVDLGIGRDPMGSGLCGTLFNSTVLSRPTTIAAGESKTFRMMISGMGEMDIARSDYTVTAGK